MIGFSYSSQIEVFISHTAHADAILSTCRMPHLNDALAILRKLLIVIGSMSVGFER